MNSSNGRVTKKVALVTGAGSGIGRAICVRLAEEGAEVVATSQTPQHLEETCIEIEEVSGRTPLCLPLDVGDRSRVEEVVAEAGSTFGPIDVLVNNAGIELVPTSPIVTTRDEDWERIFRVNVTGVFWLCRATLPHMREGGSIINIGSIESFIAFPNDAPYAATKGALLQFTRALALEAAAMGIRANCVCPGVIDTPLTRALHEHAPDPHAARTRELALSPFRRMGTAREVANCVLFLASDEASFVTGAALVVDGGATASTGPVD